MGRQPYRRGSCGQVVNRRAHCVWPLALLILAAALARPACIWARYTPLPLDEPVTVPIGPSAKPYWRLDATEPLRLNLAGPGVLSGYIRVHFTDREYESKSGSVSLLGAPGLPAAIPLTFRPSDKSRYGDARDGLPSVGEPVAWDLPAGTHTLELRGRCDDGAAVFVVLYYEGPAQPGISAAGRVDRPAAAPRQRRASRFTIRNRVLFEIAYDSNVLDNSDDYLVAWHAGLEPDQFRMRTEDDLVLAPSLELEVRRNLIAPGQTRLNYRFTRWHYLINPIKNNEEFDLYLRQYLGRGRSVEISFVHAPEQYIRQLTDRPPYTPPEDPTTYKEFRFTKNTVGLVYRERILRSLSAKLILEHNLRYYNRPFLENDISAWEIRGVAYWDVHQRCRLQLDYSYEDGRARGYDSVGETRESSDDSDGSYTRDLYRLGLTWEPNLPWRLIDKIGVSGLLMLYYYTTDKSLFDDPFHSGRKDEVTKVTFEVGRRLSKVITADLGIRFSQRAVDSPWPGDVALDKDYNGYRAWLRFSYQL
jgi:hypothetical protein